MNLEEDSSSIIGKEFSVPLHFSELFQFQFNIERQLASQAFSWDDVGGSEAWEKINKAQKRFLKFLSWKYCNIKAQQNDEAANEVKWGRKKPAICLF